MELSVGILIIGSLYWDSAGGRDLWRQWRLDLERTWLVKVPIRYGRMSESRDYTYTMVFSELARDEFGQAIVVQCRRSICSLDNLISEARWLWTAEKKKVPNMEGGVLCTDITTQDWGRVALLSRPGGCNQSLLGTVRKNGSDAQQLLDRWAQDSGRSDTGLMVTDRGTLDCDWPERADDEGQVPLDLLLATTNRPDSILPDAKAVADAWNCRPDRRDYFDENRKAEIRTFQDDQIEQYLTPLRS